MAPGVTEEPFNLTLPLPNRLGRSNLFNKFPPNSRLENPFVPPSGSDTVRTRGDRLQRGQLRRLGWLPGVALTLRITAKAKC